MWVNWVICFDAEELQESECSDLREDGRRVLEESEPVVQMLALGPCN